MKLVTFVGRLFLIMALFVAGFAGRQIIQNNGQNSHVVLLESQPANSAAPAPISVVGNKDFPAYAAVVSSARVDVYTFPDNQASVRTTYNKVNNEGAPTTFLITGQQDQWYQVLLPTRPNGTKGWVHANDVHIEGMRYRLDVHLATYKLDLYEDGEWLQSFPIGLGAAKTPTPIGTYSIIEILQPPKPNTIYGTHVLGLNGYSDVETDWPDGGHIAIHGTNTPKTTIGHKVSHGCVRLQDADIDTLAAELPLGTPVQILAN